MCTIVLKSMHYLLGCHSVGRRDDLEGYRIGFLPAFTCREIQGEVMARAQREMLTAAGADPDSSAAAAAAAGSSSAVLGGGVAAPPDLAALVDELRAEVASTRAVLQQLKLKQQQEQDKSPPRR
jgi:mevalonate pyrophosphate decarboxylase